MSSNHKKLISDWLRFVRGEQDFDVSHFYTILMDELTPEDLRAMFVEFPNGGDVEARLFNVRFPSLSSSNVTDNDSVLELIINDINEKIRILKGEDLPDLVNVIEVAKKNVRLVGVDEYLILRKLNRWPMNELMDELGDIMIWSIKNFDKKILILSEAVYGATTDYNLVWYVLKSFITIDYDFGSYFNLWSLGGEYFITDKELIYCVHGKQVTKKGTYLFSYI